MNIAYIIILTIIHATYTIAEKLPDQIEMEIAILKYAKGPLHMLPK